MQCWSNWKLWACGLLLVLVGVATPVQAQTITPSPQLATFLQSRNWWEDVGTTSSSRPFGIVFLFKGPQEPQSNGFYIGDRVPVSGFPEFGRRLGMAYYPFEYQGKYYVYMDRGYGTELLRIDGYNSQSEVLELYGRNAFGGMSTIFWSSTRSSVTPASIRNLYFK